MQNELEDTVLDKVHESALETSDRALPIVENPTVSVEDTEKIENLTAEVDNLKVVLVSYKLSSLRTLDLYMLQ